MLAVGAASSVMAYQAQNRAADQMANALSNEAANRNDQTAEAYKQLNAQASDQMSERAREARVERARLSVIGAESGLQGASANRILKESDFNFGTDVTSIESNRQAAMKQAQLEAKSGASQISSKLNSIQRPSLIGTGLQLAGSYAGASADAERTRRITQSRTTNPVT